PDEQDDIVVALVARDTTANREVGRLALPFPIERDGKNAQRPQTFASADGARFGMCARTPERHTAWIGASGVVELPRGTCIAADPALAHVLVRSGRDELIDVALATGATARLAGTTAAFAGDAWL